MTLAQKSAKTSNLNLSLASLVKANYLDMVDLDYIKIYHNAYYDEYQVVMADSRQWLERQ